jgi:hypothetical protein
MATTHKLITLERVDIWVPNECSASSDDIAGGVWCIQDGAGQLVLRLRLAVGGTPELQGASLFNRAATFGQMGVANGCMLPNVLTLKGKPV